MNIGELQRSDIFSHNEKEKHSYTAGNAVINMRFYAKELLRDFEDYQRIDKSDRQSVTTFNSIRANMNDYVQTFIDAVSALCYSPANSLRSLIRSFTSKYDLNRELNGWVEFLVRRNDLIHDYLGKEFLKEELYNALLNYEDCVMELVDFIEAELKSKNLLDVRVHKS